jgi:hypothetical protein
MKEFIPIIKWITSEILKLLSQRVTNKKERYTKIFEPLLISLNTVHRDYSKMFDNILRIIPIHEIHEEEELIFINVQDEEQNVKIISTTFQSDIYIATLKRAKNILKEERKNNDTIRIMCRSESVEILKNSKSKEEKRFLWSVLNYFLDQKKAFLTEKEEDEFVDSILENGYDYALKTPSYLVQNEIFNEPNARIIKEKILELSTKQSRHYEHCIQRCFALKSNTF